MQVNSLFVTLFTFLISVAPLATHALIIAAPSSGLTTGNNTISCTIVPTDPNSLTLFISHNDTRVAAIAQNVTAVPHVDAVPVMVTIPKGITGDGWQIEAVGPDNITIAHSDTFSVRETASGRRSGGALIGGIIAGVLVLAILALALSILRRRRRHADGAPTFDLEAAFKQAKTDADRGHARSFSGANALYGGKMVDEAKVQQWERELEEQFARARAGTPSLARGATPSPLPTALTRTSTRNL